MAFMKNSVLILQLLERSKYIYRDYTDSEFTKIRDIDNLEDYIEIYSLEDDTAIELVSYNLYGSENYWDLLIAINAMDPLFDMPYNYDFVIDQAKKDINNYSQNVYIGSLPVSHINFLTELRIQELEQENEKFRTIKVIKPSLLQDFIKKLRDEKYI